MEATNKQLAEKGQRLAQAAKEARQEVDATRAAASGGFGAERLTQETAGEARGTLDAAASAALLCAPLYLADQWLSIRTRLPPRRPRGLLCQGRQRAGHDGWDGGRGRRAARAWRPARREGPPGSGGCLAGCAEDVPWSSALPAWMAAALPTSLCTHALPCPALPCPALPCSLLFSHQETTGGEGGYAPPPSYQPGTPQKGAPGEQAPSTAMIAQGRLLASAAVRGLG